jgi:hypothetical protein
MRSVGVQRVRLMMMLLTQAQGLRVVLGGRDNCYPGAGTHMMLPQLMPHILAGHQARPQRGLLVVMQGQVTQQGTHSEGDDGVLTDGARQGVQQGGQKVHTCSTGAA